MIENRNCQRDLGEVIKWISLAFDLNVAAMRRRDIGHQQQRQGRAWMPHPTLQQSIELVTLNAGTVVTHRDGQPGWSFLIGRVDRDQAFPRSYVPQSAADQAGDRPSHLVAIEMHGLWHLAVDVNCERD